jgi:hypothetical protein
MDAFEQTLDLVAREVLPALRTTEGPQPAG